MHKGAQALKPLSDNIIQKSFDKGMQRGGEPKDEQLRISYGVIAEVNEDNLTVRVDVFERGGAKRRVGIPPGGWGPGAFLPLLQPITIIHTLYGSLRKGLVVRLFWRGKHFPGSETFVEIISDTGEEVFLSGKKKPRANSLATQPYQIFTGGLSG